MALISISGGDDLRLLLRMHVRGLAVSVPLLAMVVSQVSVLLCLLVVAVVVVMGSLAIVIRRCLMLRGGIAMMSAGWMLLCICRGHTPVPGARRYAAGKQENLHHS